MNLSRPFVERPVATALLTIGIALAGIAAFFVLPVSPLPQVDFPTISVTATLPGASPETMASSVAQPLERQLAQIPGIAQMTSTSSLGSTAVTIQFDLSRSIDGAANDIQAARANGFQSVAVASGVASAAELARHSPDILLNNLSELDFHAIMGS